MREQPVRIRPAERRDAAALARLHVRTWQAAYRGQLPHSLLAALDGEIDRRTAWWECVVTNAEARREIPLVAEEGERIVGFAYFGPSRDEPPDPRIGEVYAIYVDPEHWDHGHGRALFAAAERGLAATGFGEAMLWVLETNARARRFYEVAGWVADGAVKTEQRADIELREVRYRRAGLEEGSPRS